jgi:hypothetical protein
LSELEAQNLEVEEIKERVRTVAKKYAKDYRWCDVVNQALREAGIDPQDRGSRVLLDLEIKVSVPADIRLTDLVGLSDEEQKARIKEVIQPQVNVTTKDGGTRGAQVQEADFEVTDINLYVPPEPTRGASVVAPPGYVARYTSDEGRVMHYLLENTRNDYYGGTALCGVYAYAWPDHSSRATGGTCIRCQERSVVYAGRS